MGSDRLLDNLGREAVASIVGLDHHRWLQLKVAVGKADGGGQGQTPLAGYAMTTFSKTENSPSTDTITKAHGTGLS